MRFEVRTDVPGDEPYAVVGSDGPVGWYVTREAADAAAAVADANAPADWNGWPQLAAIVAAGPATFHLPGQHDQKSHGRWARHGTKAFDRRAADVLSAAHAPGRTVMPLTGGLQALTSREVAPDGTSIVRKSYPSGYGRTSSVDREELAARLLDSVGLAAPAIARTGPNEIAMEFVDGRIGHEVVLDLGVEGVKQLPGAKLLGLVDAVMSNPDRNVGNWILRQDGSLAPIDGGFAFSNSGVMAIGMFASYLVDEGADMAMLGMVRKKLEGLKAEFVRMNRRDWFDLAMENLDALAEHTRTLNAGKSRAVSAGGATFHLPGQHDQRTHGRRKSPVSGIVPSIVPEGGTAKQASLWHRDLDDLASLVTALDGGMESVRRITYGNGVGGSVVEHVKFASGHDGVATSYTGLPDVGWDADRMADSDQLTSAMARAFGVPSPRVLRIAQDRTVGDLIQGSTWAEVVTRMVRGINPNDYEKRTGKKKSDAKILGDLRKLRDAVMRSDNGLRLGVLDLLTGNEHRDPSTVVMLPNVSPATIQMATSFDALPGDAPHAPGLVNGKPVQPGAFDLATWEPYARAGEWIDNPLTSADVEWLRAKLEDLRGDFTAVERGDWYAFAVGRLDQLAAHATGDRNLFAPVVGSGDGVNGPTNHPDCVAFEAQGRAGRALVDELRGLGRVGDVAKFHLPGQHDQRTHGRRTPKVTASEFFHGGLEQARKVFGGRFGPYRVEVDTAERDSQTVSVNGRVVADDGETIGEVKLQVTWPPGGRPYAYLDSLKVDPSRQGSGFATEYNLRRHRWFAANGFDHEGLVANRDVGGASWAAAGYDFADELSAEDVMSYFEEIVAAAPAELRPAGEEILRRATAYRYGDPEYPTALEVYRFGWQPGLGGKDSRWPGKTFLLGTAYNAVMRFAHA